MGKQLCKGAALIIAALGVVAAPVASAAEPPTPQLQEPRAPTPVALVCDTSVLEAELGARLEAQLLAALEPLVADAGLEPGESGEALVRVQIVGFDEERRDFEVHIAAKVGDEDRNMPSVRCEACSERRLVEAVTEAAAELLGELAKSAARPEPLWSPADEVPAGDSARRRQPLTGLGIAGSVVLGAGVVACATGGYLLDRGVEDDRQLDSNGRTRYPYTITDFRTPGAATLALGAVGAGVGGALLVTDLIRRSKARRSFGLTLTPTFFGVKIRQRF